MYCKKGSIVKSSFENVFEEKMIVCAKISTTKGVQKNLCQQSVCGKRAEGVLCYVCQKKGGERLKVEKR